MHSRIEMSEEVFLSAILDKALPRKDTLPDAERRLRVPGVHTESPAWGLKIAGSSTSVRAKIRKHILIHPRHLPQQRHSKSIHPQSRYRTRMIRSQRGPAGTPNNLLTETSEQLSQVQTLLCPPGEQMNFRSEILKEHSSENANIEINRNNEDPEQVSRPQTESTDDHTQNEDSKHFNFSENSRTLGTLDFIH